MGFTRIQIAIAASVGVLLVFGFLGYIWWLSNQGPVLARSEDHDPLTGLPVSIRMNPLRDRTIERSANKFLRELRADPQLKATSVVVLTTSNDSRDKIEAYNLNIAGYLTKPVTFLKFVEVMATLNKYWTLVEMA